MNSVFRLPFVNDLQGGVLGARVSEVRSLVRSWAQVLLAVKRVQVISKKYSAKNVSQKIN